MAGRSLPSVVFIIIFTVLYCFSSSCCIADSPSSCGNIQNITCPFKLKGDHQTCDAAFFTQELSCVNNHTILYVLPDKHYYVKSINYDNLTIRIVDPGLQNSNSSSLPFPSISENDFRIFRELPPSGLNQPITMIDCLSPVISTRYINVTSPNSFSFSASVLGTYYFYSYTYIVVGYLQVPEMEDNCRIRKVAWVSLQSPFSTVLSNFSELRDAMVYGYELRWNYFYCSKCSTDYGGNANCINSSHPDHHIWACIPYSSDNVCDIRHLNSYHLSNCLGHNIRGIIWTLTNEKSRKVIGMILAARFTLGMPFLLVLLAYKIRKRHLSMYDSIEDFLQAQNNLMPIRYAYSDIKKFTNNFRDKLGEGGFGSVYKGKLRSGSFVAVKILGKSKATAQEFINEVATSGRIYHVNVVQLIGFCFEGPKRALIYDFMPNGSLEKYIFRKEGTEEIVSLSWEKIYKISCKVASGIDYLHRGCDMQILHFDIKPHNILLDKNFNPTISDFGLAKLYAIDDSIVTLTAARGTMGYMAPEMFYKNIGGISYKADVYSFGMLLMEMAGRRKNSNPFIDQVSQIHFPSWVYDHFTEGKELEMEDATVDERMLVKKMIIVALWCIQMNPSERPPMNKVIEMLEGDIEDLVMPSKPFLYPQKDLADINNSTHSSFNLLLAEE